MNLFNRVFVMAAVLIWVIIWLVVIILALLFPDQIIAGIRNFAQLLERGNTFYGQIMISLVAGAMILVGLLLLLFEVSPRQPSAVQLAQVGAGQAMMTTDSIAEKVRVEVEQISGVQQAKTTVTSYGKTADVRADVRLDPDVNSVAKAEEISNVIQDSLENRMGIKLKGAPKIFLSHGPAHRERAIRGQTPAGAESVTVREERKDERSGGD